MAITKRLHRNLLLIYYGLKMFYENQSKFRRFLIKTGLYASFLAIIIKLVKYLRRPRRKFRLNEADRTKSKLLHNELTNASTNRMLNPSINKQFLAEISYLLKLMFPRIFSKQSFLLGMHTCTLICRTFLSIYVAKLEGLLVRNIVEKNFTLFAWKLIEWILIALPATTCNSLIKYLESKLDLELKTQLIKKSHKIYFKNRVYYKIAVRQSDSTQVDQNLTEDIDKLVQILVHLYSHLTKPLLDITLITATLVSLAKSKNFDYKLPSLIAFIVISFTSTLMRRLSPKFGKMAADIAKQKGYLRFLYTRIQTNSEEIAFYAGEKVESSLINKNYNVLKRQLETVYFKKFWYIIVEQFLLKYVWSASGLIMISLPVLLSERSKSNGAGTESDQAAEVSQRTEEFTTAKNLLNSAADAVERIMSSYKEIIELTGFTRRVFDMFKLFESVNSGELPPIVGVNQPSELDTNNNHPSHSNDNEIFTKLNLQTVSKGSIIESADIDYILVDSISIISPTGDVLVPSLKFKIERGMNTLITGPNGCGKSSLFRILSGLWPLYNGTVKRPLINDLYYVPQRPYLAIGSLRDQIIYPDSVEDMKRKSIQDKDLMVILEVVNLQQVVIREGGLDSVADWKDVLSGGEKQRIGLSRLFYHRPKFAFLDECTSAVSVDVEGKIYQTAINEYKITLLTIAHRSTLWCHHNYIIQFDGLGNWKFEELNSNLEKRLDLKQEKDKLEKQLLSVTNSKARLRELCDLLGESSIAFDNS